VTLGLLAYTGGPEVTGAADGVVVVGVRVGREVGAIVGLCVG
jgi:hypothetical protein